MLNRYNGAFDRKAQAVMDIQRFCQSRSKIEKRFLINELRRLSTDLAQAQGEGCYVNLVLEGEVDPDGRAVLAGRLEALVPQFCQRCMQEFAYRLESDIRLSPVASDEEAKALPASLEPLFSEEGALDLLQIVEDEVILALPISPVHPEGECTEKAREWLFGNEEKVEKKNPFDTLAKLKQKQ